MKTLTFSFARLLLSLTLLLCGAGTQAAEPSFDIWAFDIEGNTVLDAQEIEQAVTPFLGPQRSMRDVDAARVALEQRYQQAGYLTVLVDVPEQRVDEGVVRLSVLQGRIGNLYVLGSRYHDQGWIRARVPALAVGEVPDFNQAQRELAALSSSENRRVQPVLRPGRLPGTVDLDLQVNDELPLSSNVEINNNHAHGTTAARASATLRYDNLFQREHSLALTLLTAPREPQQSRVAILNYAVPLAGGDSATLSWQHSNSDLESLGTQVVSAGDVWSLRRQVVWPREDGLRSLGIGLDFKDLREQAALSTPVRYLPLQASLSDQGGAGNSRWQFSANLTAALSQLFERQILCPNALGQSATDDQFNCKRSGASGSFMAVKLDGRWRQNLGQGHQLAARLGGQWASGPLISAEQYSLGGADTVRGYFDSELSGDLGLLGSLEWQGPNAYEGGEGAAMALNPLAFIDVARVWTLQALPGQDGRASLASVGFGLRLSDKAYDLALDMGLPLRPTDFTARGQLRIHARAVARF